MYLFSKGLSISEQAELKTLKNKFFKGNVCQVDFTIELLESKDFKRYMALKAIKRNYIQNSLLMSF